MKTEEIFSDCSPTQNQVKCLSISVISDEFKKKPINNVQLSVNSERNQKQEAKGSDISVVSEEFQRQKASEPIDMDSFADYQKQKATESEGSRCTVESQKRTSTDPEVSAICEIFQMQSAISTKTSSQEVFDDLDQAISSKQDICPSPEAPPKMSVQVLAAIFTGLAHLSVGVVFGFSGITLPQLTQPESEDLFLDTSNIAMYGSFPNIGTFFGGFIAGPVASWLGLRKTILFSLPVALALWLLMSFSPDVIYLMVARMGLGIVGSCIQSPSTAYILETVHKERRGIFYGAVSSTRQSGFLFIYALGNSSLTWRQLALICGLVTLSIPFVGLIFFPESPRWLMNKGKAQEAKKSLLFFRGKKYDLQSELDAMAVQVEMHSEQTSKNPYILLFSKSNFKIFLNLSILTLLSSGSGAFVVTAYVVPIFESTGSYIDPYVSAILVGCFRVIGSLIVAISVDRLGRKYFLAFCYLMGSICIAVFGACIYLKDLDFVKMNLAWLPIASFLIYVVLLGIGQPTLFMLHGELLPTNVRHIGIPILMSITFLGTSILTYLFPLMNESIGEYGSFWTFSVCCFFVAMITCITVPETRGLSLEEISAKSAKQDA